MAHQPVVCHISSTLLVLLVHGCAAIANGTGRLDAYSPPVLNRVPEPVHFHHRDTCHIHDPPPRSTPCPLRRL